MNPPRLSENFAMRAVNRLESKLGRVQNGAAGADEGSAGGGNAGGGKLDARKKRARKRAAAAGDGAEA